MIQIDKEPFSIINWYGGTYVVDIGDEFEHREKIYEFNLYDSDDLQEVTWVDETPDNWSSIEDEILDKFNKINK